MKRHHSEIHRITLFLLAGLIAFGVDYGVYRFCSTLGLPPLLARTLSWSAAVSTTYLVNSRFTFAPTPVANGLASRPLRLRHERYLPYVATQAVGGVISVGIFLALLPLLSQLFSLVAATLASISCNYLGARWVLGNKSVPPL